MADWKTKNKIKKTQMVRTVGNSEIDVQQLFIGTGVEKAQVFTLNDGIILGSTSCDYETGWSYEGVKAKITSKVKAWSTIPTLLLADTGYDMQYPLYADGKFTTRTIPSGYGFYTIEVAGHGVFTVYENEEPVTFEVNGIGKVYNICYKQKAETIKIRVSGVNISWAYMSSCYYFERTERNVKNTVVVTESVYGDTNMGDGLTIAGTPEGNPGGELPDLYEIIGRLEIVDENGLNPLAFDFYDWCICDQDGNNETPITRYNEVPWLTLRTALSVASWPTVINPDIMPWNRFGNYGIMDVNVSPYLREVNFGYNKNAVTHFRNMEEFDYIRAYVNQNAKNILVNIWTADGAPIYNNNGVLSLQKAPGTGADLITIMYRKVDDE